MNRYRLLLTTPRRMLIAGIVLLMATAGIVSGIATGASSQPMTSQQIAQHLLLDTQVPRYLSGPALTALELIAHEPPSALLNNPYYLPTAAAKSLSGTQSKTITGPLPIPPNVRANNPAEDTVTASNPDHSTQSETTMAMDGTNVVVGFNDTHQIDPSLFLTPGSDLTGYAYSTNSGGSFTDGGSIPNGHDQAGLSINNNFGDPWVVVDRGGAPAGTPNPMYFSTLALDPVLGNMDVGVAKSTNSGVSWTPPVMVDNHDAVFTFNDKDAIAAGINPLSTSGGHMVAAAYDGFWSDGFSTYETDEDVAVSTNGGMSWTEHSIFQQPIINTPGYCSYHQAIGSYPFIDSKGTLYVAYTLISQFSSTQSCLNTPVKYSIVVVSSTNDGATWSPEHTVVTLSNPLFGLTAGPSQFMRLFPFPYLTQFNGNLWISFNQIDASGFSRVFVSESTNGGVSWSAPIQASPTGAHYDVQPSLESDASGLHIVYYQAAGISGCGPCLTTYEASSTTGASGTWSSSQVSSVSFPFVYTLPSFDTLLAPGYMGDYIAIATSGSNRCMSWGDNRDIVTDYMYPTGRHDPDVFTGCQSFG